MTSYQWIKLYDEILDDPKMGRLSDGAYRFCINLFLLASRQEARDGSLPDMCDITWVLRLDEDTAISHLGELVRAEIVTREGERLTVTNFSIRQGKIEPAERMKQYRGRKRKINADDTDVSLHETGEIQGSYDNVTRRNIDIDKEIDQIRKEKEIYIEPLPPLVAEMISAIAGISGTTYADGINGKDFEEAAYALIGNDITPQDVAKFGEWWSSGNGFYANPPAIRTIVGKIRGTKLTGWAAAPRTNGNGHAAADSADSDTLWLKITKAVSRRHAGGLTPLEEREKVAIRAVGLDTIYNRPVDDNRVKAQFLRAYNEAPV